VNDTNVKRMTKEGIAEIANLMQDKWNNINIKV
jgi:hypothetical protein